MKKRDKRIPKHAFWNPDGARTRVVSKLEEDKRKEYKKQTPPSNL